ncbi:hypothetical protein KPH14_005219 [Odynerus spinipes]|uniref:non-specific serine/threonine protein kinase n=1 Tax=Odynerus spinipes TaxID=1348599 RepID=A0AAD9REK8_9HYME|nr:hypothetical protein KPH14_005219 [Odynerus spinipes]
MSRKLPIRTYQRKNVQNPLIKICDPIRMDLILKLDDISEERRKIDNIEENELNENSLDCDPFETTFDRIAKDAVIPPIPIDCIDDKSWYDSSFDTSNDKKEDKEVLFDVSIGTPNFAISSNTKYERFWEKMPYEKNKKEKCKKMYNTKTLSKSKHLRQLTTLKKENHIKVYQKKRKLQKVAKKKENKSSNTDSLYSASNSHSDKLYEQHIIDTGTTEMTNSSKNINSTNVISNKDIYKENIDLSNTNKSKQHNPLSETTNILNIYVKKETCPLKSINKIQEFNNKDNQNYSSTSSESHGITNLTDNFKIKSCSVILNKDNIEKWKLMINKSTDIAKEGSRVLDKISNNTLNNYVNRTYKTPMNDSNLKKKPMCSTPIRADKKTSACSILYSPINTASSMSCTAYNTNKGILHIKTDIMNDINVSVDQVQSTDLPILDQMFINNSTTAKLCTRDMTLYKRNTKVQEFTSIDHLLNSKNNKVDVQEQKLSLSETSENNSNFINNREKYDTIFMDDSIGIVLRKECNKTYQENNLLLKYLNTPVEANRSHSLFNDSESNLHTVASDDNVNSINHKSLINMNASKSYADSKLELEFSALDICNDKEILKLGVSQAHFIIQIIFIYFVDISSSYMETNKHTDKLQLFTRSTRRISVRVVRDSICTQNTGDTSFLEVYGISNNTKPGSTILEASTTKCNTLYNDENNHLEIFSSKTAKEVVLQRCSQEDYLPFGEYISNMFLKYCRKIGEGVYGEVFLYEKDKQKSVLKIIPIEGDQLINGEPQKRFNEILSEIVIAKELHNLRWSEIHSTSGFVEVKSIKCIKGKYPEEMINLWKNYDNEKTSDNDCPSIFDENQLYIAFELGHGGQDLESFEFHTAFEAHTLFIQIALALAVAEKSFKFEHRDLHWGNILISYTDEQYIYYKLDNKDISFPSNGIKGFIIDFTLSRMSYQGCCIFNDLSVDPDLFTAQGEYQFEIYRLMRDKIHNNWQEYEPYTNILWLHYILDKMVTIVRYKKKNLKKHKNAIIKLQNLKQIILLYKSAFDFINSCDQIVNLMQNIPV